MFHHNLHHFRRTVYAIVYMQVIYTVEQIGYIKLNCAAFGFLLPQQITLPVVQANIVNSRLFLGFSKLLGKGIYIYRKDVVNRIWINQNIAGIFGTLATCSIDGFTGGAIPLTYAKIVPTQPLLYEVCKVIDVEFDETMVNTAGDVGSTCQLETVPLDIV